MAALNQNIKTNYKVKNPNQGQIPANQQAARAARAAAPKKGKPQSTGQIIKGAIGGFLHRGAENFLENMQRPISEPRHHEPRHGKGSRRESRGGGGLDIGPAINPDILDLGGGGIDFSMHPDPMYQNIRGSRGGRSRRGGHGSDEGEGAKSVTVTRTTYRY